MRMEPFERPINLDEYWQGEEAASRHHAKSVREELAFADSLFQFFQSIVLQSPVKTKPEERAVFELIHAATRHYATAITLAARGHTSEVLCMMRAVVEAVDDARRVRGSTETAMAWLAGPDEFKNTVTRLNLWRFQGPMQDLRRDYDQYCDYGSHPNVAVGKSLFDTTNPARPVLAFRKGESKDVQLYLVACGLAGYRATASLVMVLWPNVRPPEILKRADELHVLRDVVLKRWQAMRRRSRLVTA